MIISGLSGGFRLVQTGLAAGSADGLEGEIEANGLSGSAAIALKSDIMTICDRIIEEKRWTPFKDYDVEITNGQLPFAACITLKDRRIHIKADKNFRGMVAGMIKEHGITIQPDSAVEAIMYFLVVHEFNHHYYCPNSNYLFGQILDGIKSVVEKKEMREAAIKEKTFEIHNMYSDTDINAIAAHDPIEQDSRKYKLGHELAMLLTLSYYSRKREGIFLRKALDKATTLFALSNLGLCGASAEMRGRISGYLPHLWRSEQNVLRELANAFTQEQELAGRAIEGRLSENDGLEIRAGMLDYGSWRQKAAEYARIIYPYLKRKHDWLKNNFTGKQEQFGQGSPGASAGQGQGDGSEKNKGGSSGSDGEGSCKREGGSDSSEKDGNGRAGIDNKSGKDSKARPAKNRSRIRHGIKGMGFGSGYYERANVDYETLDALFRERAGRIMLSADDPHGYSFEVWKGRQEQDFLDTRAVDWPSTVLVRGSDGRTHVKLYERRFPIEIDAMVRENIGGLPDICFVFDSSGSMGFEPFEGVGEYYIAALTFYSALAGLESRGIAPLLLYNVINFSDATFSSGWKPYWELDAVKRDMLDHQNGGTTLDVSRLAEIRLTRKDSYMLFFLSDLAITNMDDVEKELVRTHDSRAAQVLVFKLGGKSIASERLEGHGIQVLYPRDAYDFMHQSIDITGRLYRGVA